MREILKGRGFLVGWKEIANYLGVHPHTVRNNWQRWQLPLIFLEGRCYKTPAIHLADLESWRKRKLSLSS